MVTEFPLHLLGQDIFSSHTVMRGFIHRLPLSSFSDIAFSDRLEDCIRGLLTISFIDIASLHWMHWGRSFHHIAIFSSLCFSFFRRAFSRDHLPSHSLFSSIVIAMQLFDTDMPAILWFRFAASAASFLHFFFHFLSLRFFFSDIFHSFTGWFLLRWFPPENRQGFSSFLHGTGFDFLPLFCRRIFCRIFRYFLFRIYQLLIIFSILLNTSELSDISSFLNT